MRQTICFTVFSISFFLFFTCFIVWKFRYNLFHVVDDSSGSAWSLRNFSTIFLTYLSCRESGFPFTSSALYGGFIVTSLNTTIFGPRHITCNNLPQNIEMHIIHLIPLKWVDADWLNSIGLTWFIVFAIAIYNFWPSGLTPAETADIHRFFCSHEFRTRVLNWFLMFMKWLSHSNIDWIT